MQPDDTVGVEVPASSANLGPGFDALAVAIDLRITARTTAREDRRVICEGDGAAELPAGEDNLVWRALAAWFSRVGAPVPDVSLVVRSEIPLERGLGSSAAAAVAGAALGRLLAAAGGRDADLIALATELEGHPDNAAAAVLGGLCVVADGRAHRLAPSGRLVPVVCIPTDRQSTDAARGMVPETVPTPVAAATAARAALVLAGLSGAMALDPAVMVDEIHEPPRLAAMRSTGALVTALRDRGVAACLSGAGPTVLAVVPVDRPDQLAAVHEVARDAAPGGGTPGEGGGWLVQERRWDLAGATIHQPVPVDHEL